jgi:hypothetical protein
MIMGKKNNQSHQQAEKPQICESLQNRTSLESMLFVSDDIDIAEEDNMLFDSELIIF